MGKHRGVPSVDMSNYGNVPLNQVLPGRVVYAHVPFHDDPTNSQMRPVVVVEKSGRNVTVCPLYSRESPLRVETIRHGRRCYVDLRAIVIDRYNLVNIDPIDLDDDVWDYIADGRIIFPKEEDEARIQRDTVGAQP